MNVTSIGAAAAGVMAALSLTAVPARPHAATFLTGVPARPQTATSLTATPAQPRTTAFIPAAPRAVTLACDVGTPPGSPPTFVPALTLMPGQVTVRGALWLSGCHGSRPRLRSAWVTLRATGQASCAGARGLRGVATITWYNAAGRPIGSSKLRTRGGDLADRSAGGGLLTGTVTSGPLAGRRARGGITSADSVLACAMRGTGAVSGAGRVTFG
ncbi:hypothetical protein ACTMTF_06355 [Nonomuraea sp. ZG12]|uniref:hypothetical protein n=1 Tax=Nonomuraea sp. ZG12 TaxID=3452207 RepID=UPI003F891DE0